jgi:Flp pilus assembly protein TadG
MATLTQEPQLKPSCTFSRAVRLHSRDSGQSLIELALCMPLFLVILLGSVEMANIGWAAIQVNNAARAGAQFGSQSAINAAESDPTTGGIAIAAKADAPNLTTMTVTSSQPCQCVSPTTGNATGAACTLAACLSPNVIMDSVQVNTSAVIKPVFHYPGLPASYTITGQATLGVVQP